MELALTSFSHFFLCINPFCKVLIVFAAYRHWGKETARKNIALSFLSALLISMCSTLLLILYREKFSSKFLLLANIFVAFSFMFCARFQPDFRSKIFFGNRLFFVFPLAFPFICGPNLIGLTAQYLSSGCHIEDVVVNLCLALSANFLIMLFALEFFYRLTLSEELLRRIKHISALIFLCCGIYHFCLTFVYFKLLCEK